MNVSLHYWSPFHAKDCVFSRNEQQKGHWPSKLSLFLYCFRPQWLTIHLWRSNSNNNFKVFHVLKEFQMAFQLRYAISTFRLFIKENTAVQEAPGEHSREVWVEVCLRGPQTPILFQTKTAHFATLFKTGDTNFRPWFALFSMQNKVIFPAKILEIDI